MKRYRLYLSALAIVSALLCPPEYAARAADPTIVDFKIQALYRAAKLTWKTKDGLKAQLSAQVLRAESFEEGPYKEVEVISLIPGKNTYEYVDKSMGVESKYYYKLFVKETNEYFGPIAARPYFSPPATEFAPSTRYSPVLALREAPR